MMRPRRNPSLVYALYVNAALLAMILLALLMRGGSSGFLPAAYGGAAAPPPIAGGNGLYVMPAQFLSNVWGCYVLDSDNQTLSAYAFYGLNAKPAMRLISARNIRWDRRLNNFNTDPDPQEIRKLLEVQEQPLRGIAKHEGGEAPQTQPAKTDPPENPN